MSNDDILCEEVGPGGMTCTLPYGHKEDMHHFEVEIPTSLGQLFDGIMTATENAREMFEKAKRRQNIAFCIWVGMFVVYLMLTIVKITS
jgi:hypothetical protein